MERQSAETSRHDSLPPFIRAMLDASFYPHRPAWVRLVQTHISYVVVAPPLVYKVKKPVRFRFLDFSTRALRRHYCNEEVRLNRRLAPGVYRRVVAIVHTTGGGYALAPVDEVLEAEDYAVEMEYLPDDLRLDSLLRAGRVREAFVTEIAHEIARFHRSAATGPTIARYGAPEEIAATWQENFADAAPFRGSILLSHDDDQIRSFVDSFLRNNTTILRRRQEEGRIRDGHGDLHADHVYATHPPAIIDCVEFSERLRACDVVADVAFLAMDFDFYGREDLHDQFLLAYNSAMQDHDLPRLLPFYKCYRAYVRAKVECLKSQEPDVPEDERQHARELARRRFILSYRYTWEPLRAIVAIAGASGTGKSTLAGLLAERTGFAWIRSDVLRKEIARRGTSQHERTAYGAGIYSPEFTRQTYYELRLRAVDLFEKGRGVILDATHLLREQRDLLRSLAQKSRAPLLFVWCTCPADIVRQRLELRGQDTQEVSDANWEVYQRQCQQQEVPGEDEPDVIFVDTQVPPLELAITVEDTLRPLAVPLPPVSRFAPKLPRPFP